MKVIDPGHIYQLVQLGDDDTQTIKFIKRSGGAAKYDEEWAGLQTQEVLRALIDRTQFLYDILPCRETAEAKKCLQQALFQYEVRAYRRKFEDVNRKEPAHWDLHPPGARILGPYWDIPFGPDDIETLPIGEDGHIDVR